LRSFASLRMTGLESMREIEVSPPAARRKTP
jgi:hypothetical protein